MQLSNTAKFILNQGAEAGLWPLVKCSKRALVELPGEQGFVCGGSYGFTLFVLHICPVGFVFSGQSHAPAAIQHANHTGAAQAGQDGDIVDFVAGAVEF